MSATKGKTDADLQDILAIIATLEESEKEERKRKSESQEHKERVERKERKERLEREYRSDGRDAVLALNLQDEEYAVNLTTRENREAEDRALLLKMLAEEDAAYAKSLAEGQSASASQVDGRLRVPTVAPVIAPTTAPAKVSSVRAQQSRAGAGYTPSASLLFSVERKHATESDALLALTLHNEFLEERRRIASGKEDHNLALLLQKLENESEGCTADAGLASYLQSLEYADGSNGTGAELAKFAARKKLLAALSAAEKSKIEADLQNILQSPAVIGDLQQQVKPVAGAVSGTSRTAGAGGSGALAAAGAGSSPSAAPLVDLADAHRFTRSFIRAGAPVLTALDVKFKLSDATLSPDQVLKEVLAFVESIPKKFIKPELAALIQKTVGLIAANKANNEKLAAEGKLAADQVNIEYAETGVNIPQFLSRSWTLAKRLGQVEMAMITSCLGDNIADGGGCMPGLIARLYAVFARMVALELGVEARPVSSLKPRS